MNLRVILSLLFLSVFLNVFGQQETYFYKIQTITTQVHSASELYKKIDSLKQTRRPHDSYIKVLFDRDVDFGYKHKRIQIVFNSDCYYQLNLLIKNNTICLSSTTFALYDFGIGHYYDQFNKRHSIPVADSVKATNYLKLRNQFYRSTKTLNDLKNELDLNELYALRGGDGYNETWDKKHIDTLVRNKNFAELEKMLKSINCETQTYSVYGFYLLKKNRIKIPLKDQRIIDYIKWRNSDLESCAGDICNIIWKAFK